MAEMVCSDGEAELACAGGDGGTRRRRIEERQQVCVRGGGGVEVRDEIWRWSRDIDGKKEPFSVLNIFELSPPRHAMKGKN